MHTYTHTGTHGIVIPAYIQQINYLVCLFVFLIMPKLASKINCWLTYLRLYAKGVAYSWMNERSETLIGKLRNIKKKTEKRIELH